MIDFDHRSPGTPEADWLGRLGALDRVAPPGPHDRVVVVAAHPDDETLGAGGLIAAARNRGASVTVVVASDGEASHPASPTYTPEQLAALRRSEVRQAVARLAPDVSVFFFGLPDGRLEEFGDALSAQLDYHAQLATHLVTPWDGDGHCDHVACARVAAELADKYRIAHWQYPIWAWHWADPDDAALPWSKMRVFPLREREQAAKACALDCHVSQRSALSAAPGDEAVLSPAMLSHFARPFETFVIGGRPDATSPAYFDLLYAESDDPWELGTRFYEQRKRALVLAALPRPRFRRAFEPGCATGLLTAELAARCDEVVAWDVAERALAQTAGRVAGSGGAVAVEFGRIPDEWPPGQFDLVVLSEVGYYCPDLDLLAQQVLRSLSDDGVVLAMHWRHEAADHPHVAEAVHDALSRDLHPIVTHVEDDFVLHVWSRTGSSVATDDGILA